MSTFFKIVMWGSYVLHLQIRHRQQKGVPDFKKDCMSLIWIGRVFQMVTNIAQTKIFWPPRDYYSSSLPLSWKITFVWYSRLIIITSCHCRLLMCHPWDYRSSLLSPPSEHTNSRSPRKLIWTPGPKPSARSCLWRPCTKCSSHPLRCRMYRSAIALQHSQLCSKTYLGPSQWRCPVRHAAAPSALQIGDLSHIRQAWRHWILICHPCHRSQDNQFKIIQPHRGLFQVFPWMPQRWTMSTLHQIRGWLSTPRILQRILAFVDIIVLEARMR